MLLGILEMFDNFLDIFPETLAAVTALFCLTKLGQILQVLKEIRDELRK
jgi:hypothetical protein